MNNTINATLRAIIEAITEFLPISSTGHLFLFANFFPFQGIGEDTQELEDLFDIFIQSGAILSVLVLYLTKLSADLKNGIRFTFGDRSEQASSGFGFLLSILIGSLPIMLLGFLMRNHLDGIKSNTNLLLILGIAWLVGGIGIIIQEIYFSIRDSKLNEKDTSTKPLNIQESIVIGIVQCVALVPGISRSLATIVAGRAMGLNRKRAAEYSFFLAIPVLLAAGIYKLFKHRSILEGEVIWILGYGSIVSFILCLIVIRWFLYYIRRHSFSVFGYYRIVLGLLVLLYFYYK